MSCIIPDLKFRAGEANKIKKLWHVICVDVWPSNSIIAIVPIRDGTEFLFLWLFTPHYSKGTEFLFCGLSTMQNITKNSQILLFSRCTCKIACRMCKRKKSKLLYDRSLLKTCTVLETCTVHWLTVGKLLSLPCTCTLGGKGGCCHMFTSNRVLWSTCVYSLIHLLYCPSSLVKFEIVGQCIHV